MSISRVAFQAAETPILLLTCTTCQLESGTFVGSLSRSRARLTVDNIETQVEKLPAPSPPGAGQGIDPLLWPASKYIQRDLIERAVAWQMQAKVFGASNLKLTSFL